MAAHKRGKLSSGGKPSPDTRRPYDMEELNLGRDPLEVPRTGIFDDEQPRNEPMCRSSNQHSARFRSGLHARSNIRDIAKNIGVLASSGTDYHRSRLDADPSGQLWTQRLLVEPRDCLDIARPARAARSASLSCAAGQPK